ncbi:hypothetical protein ACIRPT_09730 [Streptomyces sp. NPDC101227]
MRSLIPDAGALYALAGDGHFPAPRPEQVTSSASSASSASFALFP